MKRDDVKARIQQLGLEALARTQAEASAAAGVDLRKIYPPGQQLEPVPAPPMRPYRARRRAASSRAYDQAVEKLLLKPMLDRRTLEERLLLAFTPAEVFTFLHQRTVPPADEDGLRLIEAYPELSRAAPELVADLAVAFRRRERREYAAYFALVAKHHGLAP